MAGAQGGHEAVVTWFTDFQKSCIVKNGITPEWFHGIISRKVTEDMLMTKPPGYFLIRVSESRIGYTLSYRAEDRCRHFMIDVLPGNQYVIVGEKMRHHSLHDLVAFHRRTPLSPYSEVLTVACGQISKDDVNYAKLLLPKRMPFPSGTEVDPDTRPCLPTHPNASLQPASNQGLNVGGLLAATPSLPARLYPSLETENGTLILPDVGSPLRPAPTSTARHMDTPPPMPPRNLSPHSEALSTTAGDKRKRPPAGPPERPLPSPGTLPGDKGNTQKSQAEGKAALISLAQCKKLFQRKKNHTEEHTYIEIDANEVGKGDGGDNNYQKISGDVHGPAPHATREPSSQAVVRSDGKLPTEYFNPPPFAPGY